MFCQSTCNPHLNIMASYETRAKWMQEFNEGINDPFEFISEDKWFCHTCELTLKVKKNKEIFKFHLKSQGHQKCKDAKNKPGNSANPKPSSSVGVTVGPPPSWAKWMKEFNEGVNDPFEFIYEDKWFCHTCDLTLKVKKNKEIFKIHLNSQGHQRCKVAKAKPETPQKPSSSVSAGPPPGYGAGPLPIASTSEQAVFEENKRKRMAKELCKVFVAANLSWNKIDNPELKDFFERHIKIPMPSREMVRRQLDGLYTEVYESIKKDLAGKPFWLGIDECTDAMGRPLVNVLMGALGQELFQEPYLVECTYLDGPANNESITDVVQRTIQDLFGFKTFDINQFRALLSDAVGYMLRAGKNLKAVYPKLLHITCLCHALHRVCEHVREMFPKVNHLIGLVKKIFLKAPSRINAWYEKNPTLPLPPEPCLTRWGTWVDAAVFYHDNFDALCNVVLGLNPEDAAAIPKAQELLNDPDVPKDLEFIGEKLKWIPSIITCMEESGSSIDESLDLFAAAKEELDKIDGRRGVQLRKKFDSVVERNPDLDTLKTVWLVHKGEECCVPDTTLTMAEVGELIWCPVTSVDVER